MEEHWREAPRQEENAQLAAELGVSPMLVRMIRNRGVEGKKELLRYLRGGLEDLHDPRQMKGIQQAAELLRSKIKSGARVRIIGDYDIDGVNSTYILLTGFRRLGARVDTVIPDRMKDGYGLNENLIRAAAADGVDTIVTCDNGIAASREIALGKELGLTMVVTDHHEVPYEEEADGNRRFLLPPADAIVNPKQPGCPYPFKKLCGAAVAFKLIQVLYREEGVPQEELWSLLEFVAVATVGDVMELQGENRIFVKYGLSCLEHTENRGYRALLLVNDLAGKKLNTQDIGFTLGPCINASGRLDTARRALNLLCASTDREAQALAGDLKALNESRKDLTARGTRQAVDLIENSALGEDRVLVVYLPDCHESLAGIIAGDLKKKYYRPCFVLTKSEEGVKGSGRSIETYSMYEELTRVRDLFTKFGGHPMAAGLSLHEDRVDEFRQRINDLCTLTPKDLVPVRDFDGGLHLQYVGEELMGQLELMEPCGNGNKSPLFVETGVQVVNANILGKNRNVLKVKLKNQQGTSMEGIYFGDAEGMLADMREKGTFYVLYYPRYDEYMGNRRLQIRIEGIR
ncbi:MAG: single-stranded-DNA-specific exonuclease RecJ [Lachnospiraceae bacterium]|jgi:single-stranded-DNA-specific exonuclease|nr:single-stranded-DNA-specific exonuclease RecJ [Lachnospiraceae bacterium]